MAFEDVKLTAAEPPKTDTIDSLLGDIQSLTDDLSKTVFETCRSCLMMLSICGETCRNIDRLIGGKPEAGKEDSDKVAAANTVVQRLRDIRRQLSESVMRLGQDNSRISSHF